MVPGARHWETSVQTEERKRISYLIRQRTRVLASIERRVLDMLYALRDDSPQRSSCATVANALNIPIAEVHKIASDALGKIYYERRRRA